jgi:protein ImuB
VDRVRLWADQTIPLRPRQEQFFPDPASAADGHVSQLIERLTSRLGQAAVLRPVFEPDPLPERAVRYVAVIGRSPSRGQKTENRRQKQQIRPLSSVLCPLSSHRPLRLLAPPAPIEMGSTTFRWLGRRHVIARRWGPERIETGWWRGGGIVRRDCYRVETTDGRRFWLFRDLKCDDWFLHGIFE